MSFAFDSSPRPRRTSWREFIPSNSLVRHPVSVARQRLGILLLVLMLLAFGLYSFSTRDEAIRKRAINFMMKITPGGVEIDVQRASFEMFDGITLHDVCVSVPYDKRLDPKAVDSKSRTIFSSRAVKLIHNPWRLLLGSLRVERVVAVEPTIILSHNVDTGLRNWDLLSDDTKKKRTLKRQYRPVVTLRSANAKVVSIDRYGSHESLIEKLDADVRPHPQAETGYYIEIRRYSEPIERTRVLFDPGERMVANTPYVDAKTIRLQLPKAAQQFFDWISLTGEVKLSRLNYDSNVREELDTEIELRHVGCEIPLWLLSSREAAEAGTDGDAGEPNPRVGESVLRMKDVQGVLTLRENQLRLDVSGLINGARCGVTGTVDRVTDGMDVAGINMRFQGKGVPTPEGKVRKRLLTDEGVPSVVRKYFEYYDPHGLLDFDLRFDREAGQDQRLFVTGTVRPRGVRASCKWFPYPLEDVDGTLRFEKERVVLEDLHGRHAGGQVVINVDFDRRTAYSDIKVDVKASTIPLDEQLYQALPEHYQSAWRQFPPRGIANIHASLHRPGGTREAGRPRWQKRITIDLIDSQISVPSYPHPLEGVHGRLDVESDRIKIEELTGRCQGASVRLDGYAILKATESPQVEIRVDAKGIRIDESFGAALPPDGRGAFAQFQPKGLVDLSGTLSYHDEASGLIWDLNTHIYDTSIRYDHFPYRVEGVSGKVAIRPDRISIVDAHGRHNAAQINAHGEVRRHEDGFAADLTFDADKLTLDQELYQAMPPSLKDVWNLLKPEGRVKVRTGLHFVSEADQRRRRHRTEIVPLDAKICFRGFALPLSSVTGRVLVTNRRVEILSLRGETDGGVIELSGEIELEGPGHRGTLIVNATDMTFNKKLLTAMPRALRRFFQPMKPRGRFNLRLDPLRFETDMAGRTRWDFDGQIELTDAHADLGVELHNCNGTLAGNGTITKAGHVSVELNADLAQTLLAGWHLENVKARILTDPITNVIHVEDARANLYDGEATGFAEIVRHQGDSYYEASFTMRELQLSEYLKKRVRASRAESDFDRSEMARGSVAGNLVLRGKTGKGGYREGAGEVFVSEAQVWKLPIILAIFQVLNLTPDENVFHDGRLKYYLSRDRLTLQKIDLQGKAISFIGGGSLDLRTDQLDVTLLAGSPVRIRVPLLTDILEGASREIMEVQVTGTLGKPTIRPQPLKSLTAALKTIFPEVPRSFRERPISRPQP
ncbi:MAG: AsmA-like C-terminal domain-containing protein [Phycisphaerales bacterium]|nr:AsmA-like C-terminal domain-containing protein [Phycisphaerales bacterium]